MQDVNFLDSKHIGQKIADLRIDRDIQQRELAAAIGVHQSVLNRIEKGRRSLREDELLSIARYLNVTTDYLLGNDVPLNEREMCCTYAEKELLRKYRAIGRENEKHVDALLESFYSSLALNRGQEKAITKIQNKK